jgi:thiamine-monophosphate kinase
MELSEDELVAAIDLVLAGEAPGVVLGIGDDAAIVEPGAGQLVLTTDLLVEGVHFEQGSISARDLGAKAITVNVSDLAAMAASPRFALVSLALTGDVPSSWVVELYGGMRDACGEYAVSLVGGDLSRGPAIVISVTAAGQTPAGRAVTRSGARPGDVIVVTGSLGAAAGGLALSRLHPSKLVAALSEPWARELLDAFARPVARVGEGQTLAQCGATAMMDVSDGLAKDLGRLCVASAVGARVELARVPVSRALLVGAETLEADPLELAISGGEDYELLATIDVTDLDLARERLHERSGIPLSEVGVVVDGDRLEALDPDGNVTPLEPVGWDHFGEGA